MLNANYYGLRWSANELRALPTITTGQADDLKIDTGTTRVWLARVGIEDGAPYNDQVTVETLTDGRWIVTDEYPGGDA